MSLKEKNIPGSPWWDLKGLKNPFFLFQLIAMINPEKLFLFFLISIFSNPSLDGIKMPMFSSLVGKMYSGRPSIISAAFR